MNDMKITREQVLGLKNTMHKDRVDFLLKEWFPKAFKPILQVGKWYKSLDNKKQLIFVIDFIDAQHIRGYGFDTRGDWNGDDAIFSWGLPSDGSYELATQEEVFEALKSELRRLGVKKGAWFNCLRLEKPIVCFGEYPDFVAGHNNEDIYFGGVKVYEKGKFAQRVETITLQEAEKQLGKKII
jgi:hypothetical protein